MAIIKVTYCKYVDRNKSVGYRVNIFRKSGVILESLYFEDNKIALSTFNKVVAKHSLKVVKTKIENEETIFKVATRRKQKNYFNKSGV